MGVIEISTLYKAHGASGRLLFVDNMVVYLSQINKGYEWLITMLRSTTNRKFVRVKLRHLNKTFVYFATYTSLSLYNCDMK